MVETGGTTPSCTVNCPQSSDNQPPQTTVRITSKIEWPRGNTHFYYQNFTVTLHAVDDENLSSIILNDTGTASTFDAHGLIATSTIIITLNGLHALSYYSTDKTGNKETPHHAVVGLSRPDLSDLQGLIRDSGLDNAGIKSALTVKVETAQDQLAKNQSLDALNALSNQLNALAGRPGPEPSPIGDVAVHPCGSDRAEIMNFRPRRYSTTPDITIGIPTIIGTPNALELTPNRATITPEIRIIDPIRFCQKRNCDSQRELLRSD